MLAVLDPQAGKVALLRVAGGPPLPISGLEGARYAAFDSQGDLLVAHGTSVAIIDAVRQSSAELSADPGAGPITHLATDPGGSTPSWFKANAEAVGLHTAQQDPRGRIAIAGAARSCRPERG